MHTHSEGQWPQDTGEEEWQQQTVHFFTYYRELELFQPAYELTHQRPTKKRKRTRAKPGRQHENDIPQTVKMHKRRGLHTATLTNARRTY
ncbi:hypothetical protein FVER14953_20861 [Fusarium verticillioides]|nr:hypothetical protein FVER14953_20861 [Fusarium verticillioides]